MKRLLKIGVLVSGRGSNLQAIIDKIENGYLNCNLNIVISDNENARALDRAEKHNIKSNFIDPEKYKSKKNYEDEMIKILEKEEVELVIMAGFMRILSPYFINHFENKIMNIHPSLLPSFPGLDAQKQALDYGVKISGCTVHFASEKMDDGPIIIQ
ncbi:MAG: phosphoribosylglycinamide formyltransferase, partial [Bacillota bacterium]